MTIKRDDVIHTAKLARLALTPAEIDRYGEELSRITEYMAQLKEAAGGADASEPVLPLHKDTDALRDDEVRPHPMTEDVVLRAPDHKGPFFRVPMVIG
jgi:aspartyl-tRNA(Asn)/glutamyl-tRNA(Gln) amidotransferase subunit C